MKKTVKFAMAIALTVAAMGFAACDPEDDIIENDGTYYAFHFSGKAVQPLDTVFYTLTREEIDNNLSQPTFVLENLTNGALSTTQKVEVLEGPASLIEKEKICGGGQCPWDGNPYTLEPGMNPEKTITIDIYPNDTPDLHTALFKLTVGEASKFAHATIIYLRVNI